MSRFLKDRLNTIKKLRQYADEISSYEVTPGSYMDDPIYTRRIDTEIQPRVKAMSYYLEKYGDEELSNQFISLFDLSDDSMAIVAAYSAHLSDLVKENTLVEGNRILGLYSKAAKMVATRFSSRKGSQNWRDLLHKYLPKMHDIQDKGTAIVRAMTLDISKFEDVLALLLSSHEVNEIDRHLINDRLRPLGLEVSNRNVVIEVDANLGLGDLFGGVADKLAEQVARGEVSRANFDIYQYHRERVADAYYRLDWKGFSGELRHLEEAFAKCLSKWDGTHEFKMEAALQAIYGTKGWQCNVLYGAFRLLSGEGGHSGVPNETLCLAAYNLIREVLRVEYKIK
jgi:hypothetical protein